MPAQTQHLKQVCRWLDENVASYPTPRAVTLSDFEVDWEQMSGRFYVSLDGQRIQEPFRLSLAQNGWVQSHPPMFTSPLGAPASYVAVELTTETSSTINKLLRQIFPRLKPLGLDRISGALISMRTPVIERITNNEVFNCAKDLVTRAEFSRVAML